MALASKGTDHADDADEPDDTDDTDMTSLLHRDITERVLNSFYGVYDEHGYGFAEAVYARSLAVELQCRGVNIAREVPTTVMYKGVAVGSYRADLIVEGMVLVEVKATKALGPGDEKQVLNYLKATGLEVGLILNFGPRPSFRRMIFSPRAKALSVSSA